MTNEHGCGVDKKWYFSSDWTFSYVLLLWVLEPFNSHTFPKRKLSENLFLNEVSNKNYTQK